MHPTRQKMSVHAEYGTYTCRREFLLCSHRNGGCWNLVIAKQTSFVPQDEFEAVVESAMSSSCPVQEPQTFHESFWA